MLGHIVQIVESLIKILYYFLVVSYNAGKIIFKLLVILKSSLLTSLDKISAFLFILYNDFLHFFNDLTVTTSAFVDSLNGCIEGGLNSIKLFYDSLAMLFIAGGEKLSSSSNPIANILTGAAFALRNLTLLLGNGIWFLITLLPNLLRFVFGFIWVQIETIGEIISLIIAEIVETSKNSTPQMICGIIAFIIAVYKYRVLKQCLRYVGRQLWMALVFVTGLAVINLKREFQRGWMKVRTLRPIVAYRWCVSFLSLHNQSKRRVYSGNAEEDYKINNILLCVICSDREKCILFEPCKHLCVCDVCVQQIYEYGSCPLCRVSISRFIKVYL